MTRAAIPHSVSAEADRLEIALKAAQIPSQLHDGLWDVWANDPARAHHLIARFKDYPQTQAMRFKDSDPLDVAYQALKRARDAGDAGPIQAALQQLATLAMPASGTAGMHLSDSQKPATKDAHLRPTAFVDDFGRPLARPARDVQGRPLK